MTETLLLALDSPRWGELEHAYGTATDIPALLAQLSNLPSSTGDSEPWFSLWSALAHQGDVYSASFAAVPYVIEALSLSPESADFTYFQFPAWVEVCRHKNGTEIPADLAPAYLASLKRLPQLVAAAAAREWDSDFLQCALSAIAASKGQPVIAEAVQELSPAIADEFLAWFYEK